MIKSAVTVCLVPEARQGPFVYHDGLADGCQRAARAGFDAVEIFPRSVEDLNAKEIRQLLEEHQLGFAAMGTGAGAVVHQLTLSHPDAAIRRRACDFVSGVIDFAGSFGAPAIIGSMQGKAEGETTREQALAWLAECLEQLGPRAHATGAPLLIEPLNRYETNLLNTVADSTAFVKGLKTTNVKLLCDLFHMNIEEVDLGQALRDGGDRVGHVHYADSNRRAVGMGHSDLSPAVKALGDIGYDGYASAEVFPVPDSDAAAQQTIKRFKVDFGTGQ